MQRSSQGNPAAGLVVVPLTVLHPLKTQKRDGLQVMLTVLRTVHFIYVGQFCYLFMPDLCFFTILGSLVSTSIKFNFMGFV